jgi:surface antigen
MNPGARSSAMIWAPVICAALIWSSSAFAFEVLGIGDMPIRYMTEEDLAIFKAAVIRTLDQTADNVSAPWTNQNTGAHGTLTPLASFRRQAQDCRKLQVTNSAGGRDNRSEFTLCKLPDGDWKVHKQ